LENKAYQIRRLSLEMICYGQWGHLGGSFSMAEILSVLFFHEMNVKPENPSWDQRDRLILSKAHGSPALYAAMALRGFFPVENIYTYCEVVIHEALANRKDSPNICCKIPTTHSGLEAMEYLVGQDIPLNATEIFGIAQAVKLIETYQCASKMTGKSPMLYISHIAGIYDDHFKNVVEQQHIDISPDILWQGGLAVARKLYQLMEERHYQGIFIAGGARGLHHLTEMVGGKVCCTINWEGTADKLLEQNPPVVYRLFNPVEKYVIDELMDKLVDFKRGYLEDGLAVHEFEEFGPVQLFRSMFLSSWQRVLEIIKKRRAN
jgi:transaldolase